MKTCLLQRSTLAVLGALALGGVSASAAVPASLPGFNNGGFEQTAPGSSPSLTSPGWTTFAGPGSDEFIEDAAIAFDGDWYLQMASNLSSSDEFVTTPSTSIAVTPGQSYTVSAMFSTPSTATVKGTGNIMLFRANFRDASGNDIAGTDIRIKPYDGANPPFPDELIEDAWVEGTGTGVAPAGAAFARVSFVYVTPFSEAGTVLIDNVRLIEAGTELVGDYNGSGQIEQGDLDLVLLNWGTNTATAGIPRGWTNDSPTGLIDQDELDGVLLNWGNTAEPAGSAVPEPATAALLSLGGLALLRRRAA